MPAECSYHHSVSCLVRRQVVTILSFYFRAELLVRLARFPLFCWRYFFSSQDVFRTFSQNEVLIFVFVFFLELIFRCFPSNNPGRYFRPLFAPVRVTNFCPHVTRKLHSFISQSKLNTCKVPKG